MPGIGEAIVYTAAALSIGVAADSLSGGGLLGNDVPDAPDLPEGQTPEEKEAEAKRKRALLTGGRQSTVLVDDTETPAASQIPISQVGRTALLGG